MSHNAPYKHFASRELLLAALLRATAHGAAELAAGHLAENGKGTPAPSSSWTTCSRTWKGARSE